MKKSINLNIKFILFLFFVILFLFCGFYISYDNTSVTIVYDRIFDADSPRVYNNFFSMNILSGCFEKHPLSIIFLQPIFSFFDSFFHSNRATFIFVQSLCGASIVTILYQILFIWTKNYKLSLLLSVIYGVSFSTLIFTAIPELYIFAALGNSLLFLYLSLLAKKTDELNFYDYINISVLTLFSGGVILFSFITNFILILWLLKHKNKTNSKRIIKNISFIIIITILLFCVFWVLQHNRIFNIPLSYLLENARYNFIKEEAILPVIYGVFVESFYALKIDFTERVFYFPIEGQNFLLIPSICLWGLAILCYAYKVKNKEISNNYTLFFSLAIISVFTVIGYRYYSPRWCFLYSQNILIYLIVLLGIMLNNVLDKFVNIALIFFIMFQVITNSNAIITIEKMICENPSHNYYEYLMYTAFIVLFISGGGILLKKIINKHFSLFPIEKRFNIIINIFLFIVICCAISLAIFKGRM